MVVLHLAREQANKRLAKRSRFLFPLLRARPLSLAISPKWRVRELIRAWSLVGSTREGRLRIDEFVAQKEMALLLFRPVKVAV